MTEKTTLSTLDRIRAIIEADISAIEEAAEEGALDKAAASKLVDYAKLEIALQKHSADMADYEEANELARQEYEDLKAKVAKSLSAGAVISEPEPEDDDQ